jgi:hypothetical protein
MPPVKNGTAVPLHMEIKALCTHLLIWMHITCSVLLVITETLFAVPSENKKDVRSIEQTLADIQSKKRQKVSHNPAPDFTE